MRAAVALDYDAIEIQEVPRPICGPQEAVVQVKACGICAGDVTPWFIRRKCPGVVGHEPAGVIVEVGSEVTRFAPGDRVFVHHHAPCLGCRHCQRGFYTMCPTWRASRLDPGGIAEFVRVPRENLEGDTLHLPDYLTFEDGTLIEPAACVVKAFRRAGFVPGQRLAILGCGFIGQVMVRLARYYGAELIVASDPVAWRREKALEAGAHVVVDSAQESFPERVRELTDGGADVVMVGPSSPAAMLEGIACAGKGSVVLLFMGPEPGVKLELEPNHLFFNEISLVSSYSCGPDDTRDTLYLIREGILSSDDLVTHRFPLEQTLDACRLTEKAGESLKVLVTL